MEAFRKRYIGDRAFYKMVLAIVIPIIIQNAITNFVSLLDNVMVGQVGTEPMSGVAIANQLMFVFNLCIFGGISGAGIFSAQFHGADDQNGVRHCFRYKLYLGLGLSFGAVVLFLLRGKTLIGLYLNDVSDYKVAATLDYGMGYLRVMLFGLPAFALAQIYASTLRETGETGLPMRAGVVAVFVNLTFNWLLIFGNLGFPAMGVRGAALATVLSRYVELAIVAVTTHMHPERFQFVRGLYASPRVPMDLVKKITVKGMPLLVNEALWSLGMATLTQSYSMRGLNVVAAMNISTTVSNLFAASFLSMGSATAIIIGQSLGADDLEGAKDKAWKLIAFSIFLSLCGMLLLLAASPLVPRLYKTEDQVRTLAMDLLMIYAVSMPLMSYCNSAYFILRSGGKTLVTFVFDSGFTWVVAVPLAWCLTRLTSLDVRIVYLCIQLADFIKVIFGRVLIKRDVWVNNMVKA